MALVTCLECGKSVSELAAACPNCGAPIQGRAAANAVGQSVVTTEATSKRLKLHSLCAGILILLGFGTSMASAYVGNKEPSIIAGLALLVGLPWFVITRFRIWWHHR